MYVPDYYAKSIADIDFVKLKEKGIKAIAFDADSTLVPFSIFPFKKKIIAAKSLRKLRKSRNLFDAWIIASNRPTNDLQEIAKIINAEVVRASLLRRKPRRTYFKTVIRQAGVQPRKIAMVGDKLIADIYGANRMGITSVWVHRIGRDNPIDILVQSRRFENWLIKKYIAMP